MSAVIAGLAVNYLYILKDLIECNFEADLCMWTQATRDQFDWTWRQGATPSSFTGPSQSATGAAGKNRI